LERSAASFGGHDEPVPLYDKGTFFDTKLFAHDLSFCVSWAFTIGKARIREKTRRISMGVAKAYWVGLKSSSVSREPIEASQN